MDDEQWIIIYLAWLDNITLQYAHECWKDIKEISARHGHFGDCTKKPISCYLCLKEECERGGIKIKKAWLEAINEI